MGEFIVFLESFSTEHVAELKSKDETVHFLVDIGLPYTTNVEKVERARRYDFLKQQSQDKNLCKLARFNQRKSA